MLYYGFPSKKIKVLRLVSKGQLFKCKGKDIAQFTLYFNILKYPYQNRTLDSSNLKYTQAYHSSLPYNFV